MTKVLMKGTEAIAEAAVQAGCKYFYGYPITPQNEIPEYMSKRLFEVGGVYLQAESEVVARWDISMEPIMTMFQEKPEQVFSSSNT